MSAGIVVIGGGEHARVVIEAIRAGSAPREVLGFVDPEPCEETVRRLGARRLGDEDALERHAAALGVLGFAALESRSRREAAVARLSGRLGGWATVVHSSAWVSPSAVVGEGTVIMAGAVVQTGARLGAHCVINTGAVVEHDAVIGEHAHLAPGVTLGGAARIGPLVYVGLGATVRDHTSVGAGATIAMGAVVVRDVPSGARVMGVPAR